jgi:hypothetical protein
MMHDYLYAVSPAQMAGQLLRKINGTVLAAGTTE